MPGGSKAFGCTRRKGPVRQEFSHVDDLGDGKQIAARDRRTFRRIGLCRRSATDSSNTIQSRFDCRQKVEGGNVKCLDLTPTPPLEDDEANGLPSEGFLFDYARN